MGRALNRGMQQALVISVVVTALLYVVPYGHVVGRPLVWLSTLAHELGHGLTALLLGGRFERLELYADASGVAWTAVRSTLAEGLVAAGGLMGPAIAAAGCFVAARSARGARIALGLAAVGLVAVDVLFVRNVFGFAFVGLTAVLLGGVAWRFHAQVARFVATFLGVQLSLAVFSRWDYLFAPVAHTGGGTLPSDVAKMADALWLPYWFWGAVCGLVSLGVLAFGLWVSVVRPGPAVWPFGAPAVRDPAID